MTTRVEPQGEGWALWIYNEDHVAKARQELDAYLKDPDDPRYRDASRSAQAVVREKQQLDRVYRKNVRDLSGRWDRTNFRRRPVTVSLIAISVTIYLLTHVMHTDIDFQNYLLFSSLEFGDRGLFRTHGLDDILHGQVWRLITPIFLHSGLLHILFNMWWLRDLGTLIEYRRGTRVLAMLVFLSAVSSNVAEFAYELSTKHALPGYFGGMSGVVYALFGYVWMKGRIEPEQGMILHPRTVQLMLIWLVLCMTNVMGPIANVAHLVGLVVGVLYGLARF
jgi:GlpG protein